MTQNDYLVAALLLSYISQVLEQSCTIFMPKNISANKTVSWVAT